MKGNVRKKMRETLAKECICYVLITCGAPDGEGNMAVEMDWEGDPDLAQMLLHDAFERIEMENDEEFDGFDGFPILVEQEKVPAVKK